MKKKLKTYILDTSAILAGKPLNLDNLVTTPGVSKEFKPGGRDYRFFQFLIEKGLTIQTPSKKTIDKIKTMASKTGDLSRLSDTDFEILAVAYEIKKQKENVVILTDDYSIQNLAAYLDIKFENIKQNGITKKFKWITQCRGCGKKFKENINKCPICGSTTKNIVCHMEDIKKKQR